MDAPLSPTPGEARLPVVVVSDVVCPWCFIGKRRLEKALALKPDIPVEVIWHPYFLNPWVPREGIDRTTYLTTKFGSVERYAAISRRIIEAGGTESIPFAFDKISRQPNTLDCHRLILWSRNAGDPGRMKERLMQLYFIEGADLTDRETLVQAGRDCGMDGDLVRNLLAGDADVERIEGQANAAKEAGIDGVPCFVFGNVLAVSGAQSPEYLANALARAADQLKRTETSPEV